MFKLLFFTAAMIILPLGMYWFTLNYIFEGTYSDECADPGYNYTKAGVTAIAAAHIVLFAYIYVAIKEDSADQQMKKQQ
jgi:vacuolar ATPase assembly integral membrane protein VMA21